MRSRYCFLLLVTAAVTASCKVPPPAGPPLRAITFPVAGFVHYTDSFGAPRSGGRTHAGQDLMGAKGTPLVAAVDGTVTSVRFGGSGLSGNSLTITDAEGWRYLYIHLNNDRPGTDDGAGTYEQAFADGIREGQKVRAGEPVGFLGDSGNAENTGAHLHFELHSPDGAAQNAYSTLRAGVTGAWSAEQLASSRPYGLVDSVEMADGAIHARGWAIDRATDDPVEVSVYVDGNPATTGTADQDRADLPVAFPGVGPNHGFHVTTPAPPAGVHRICLVAHNAGAGGGSSRIGCTDTTV